MDPAALGPGPVRRPPGGPPTVSGPDAGQVAQEFGLGRVDGPLTFAARGELGRIWRLTTDRGAWAVKELFVPPGQDDARRDVELQQAALTAGVPLPRPVLTGDGAVLAVVGAGERRVIVRVYAWVDLADPPASATLDQAAELLGRMHGAGMPDPRPVDPWFTRAVAPSRWDELAAAARQARASWAGTLEALAPLLEAGASIIAAGRHEPAIRCHLDVNPQNVLLDRTGSPVVVDWENSGPASPEQELASVLAEFVPDPKHTPAFLAAYRSAGGPVARLDASSFALTLAVQAHLVEMYAARALDDRTPAQDRDRAVFWIEDIAANVVTPAKVAAWVAHADG